MGGTRFLGVETVEALLRAGHDVTIFHRGSRTPKWSAPVDQVLGPRPSRPIWPTCHSGIRCSAGSLGVHRRADHVVAGRVAQHAHLVHVSTLNVYDPSPLLPWPEDTPYGPYPLWGAYAVDKIGCEMALRTRRPRR